MTDPRCLGCPNLGYCSENPSSCKYRKKKRDWRAIRDKHKRERERKEQHRLPEYC